MVKMKEKNGEIMKIKNILIITNTRDNLGSAVSFIKDIDDIKDMDLKEMVLSCINNVDYDKNGLWSSDDMCGSENRGYAFDDFGLSTNELPVTIEHIVNYVF